MFVWQSLEKTSTIARRLEVAGIALLLIVGVAELIGLFSTKWPRLRKQAEIAAAALFLIYVAVYALEYKYQHQKQAIVDIATQQKDQGLARQSSTIEAQKREIERLGSDLQRAAKVTAQLQEQSTSTQSRVTEIEEKNQPRHLTPEQHRKMIRLLSPVRRDQRTGQRAIMLLTYGREGEVLDFRDELRQVFISSGWSTNWRPIEEVEAQETPGLILRLPPVNGTYEEAKADQAIYAALAVAGPFLLVVLNAELEPKMPTITVGKKPPFTSLFPVNAKRP